MGREARCELSLAGQTGQGQMLLEADVLILRGAVRRQLPRTGLGVAVADGETLVIPTPEGPLRAALGAAEAARWVKALARAAPGLAEKLGLGPDKRAHLLTAVTDPDLIRALEGHITASPSEAAFDLAEVTSEEVLQEIVSRLSARPVWMVTVKGKASPLPEDRVRAVMRAMGQIDSKSCAVSAVMTATRFAPRRP